MSRHGNSCNSRAGEEWQYSQACRPLLPPCFRFMGFRTTQFNQSFFIKHNVEVNGVPTYWDRSGMLFLYWQISGRRWALCPRTDESNQDLLKIVQGGGVRGLAYEEAAAGTWQEYTSSGFRKTKGVLLRPQAERASPREPGRGQKRSRRKVHADLSGKLPATLDEMKRILEAQPEVEEVFVVQEGKGELGLAVSFRSPRPGSEALELGRALFDCDPAAVDPLTGEDAARLLEVSKGGYRPYLARRSALPEDTGEVHSAPAPAADDQEPAAKRGRKFSTARPKAKALPGLPAPLSASEDLLDGLPKAIAPREPPAVAAAADGLPKAKALPATPAAEAVPSDAAEGLPKAHAPPVAPDAPTGFNDSAEELPQSQTPVMNPSPAAPSDAAEGLTRAKALPAPPAPAAEQLPKAKPLPPPPPAAAMLVAGGAVDGPPRAKALPTPAMQSDTSEGLETSHGLPEKPAEPADISARHLRPKARPAPSAELAEQGSLEYWGPQFDVQELLMQQEQNQAQELGPQGDLGEPKTMEMDESPGPRESDGTTTPTLAKAESRPPPANSWEPAIGEALEKLQALASVTSPEKTEGDPPALGEAGMPGEARDEPSEHPELEGKAVDMKDSVAEEEAIGGVTEDDGPKSTPQAAGSPSMPAGSSIAPSPPQKEKTKKVKDKKEKKERKARRDKEMEERVRREVEEELRQEEARRAAGPAHRPKWRPELFEKAHLDEAPASARKTRMRKQRGRTVSCLQHK